MKHCLPLHDKSTWTTGYWGKEKGSRIIDDYLPSLPLQSTHMVHILLTSNKLGGQAETQNNDYC
jgi:hypothetical protein